MLLKVKEISCFKRAFCAVSFLVINWVSCQSITKNNSELIFSNKFDENMTIECFVSNDELNYRWEFLLKDKQGNLKIDRLEISKQKLMYYNPLANRPKFYRQFKVLAVFKNLDKLIFVLDKFGQIDVNVYSISNKTVKEIIPIKNTDLTPMDTEILGEDFQDLKMEGDVICCLSKHLRGSNSVYYISRVNLQDKKSEEGSIDVSKKDSNKDTEQLEKSSIYLEDCSYKLNNFGYKFCISKKNTVFVIKDNFEPFEVKIDYRSLTVESSKDINSIIKSY